MKWRELRGFYFPLCMEETSKAKAKYGALIQQLQKTNSEKDRKAVIEFRKSIEQRIIEIDKFIEENFDQKFVLHFEKCKIKLKKLLQINPKEKLIKQSQNKYFHDVDSLNKLIKKQQEKEKEEKKKKIKDEPKYNYLPADYGLYEGIIESMKLEEIRNKNYLDPNKKYFGEISINNDNNESLSQDDFISNNKNNNNFRVSFGNNYNNFVTSSYNKNNTKTKNTNKKNI